MEDGAVRIFLSTKGQNSNEVPAELVNFLRYVENSTDDCAQQLEDKVVTKLHDRMTALKKSREWERSNMRFEELLQDAKKEEQNRVQKLISLMTEAAIFL